MPVIDVKSEIAGKVWKIETGPGSPVDEDTPIMILESMKMEIPVVPDKPAKVVEILVAEGDTVAEDQVLARVEI